jgi:hypothetical protein
MRNEVFDAYTNLLRMINPRCLIATYAESKQILRQSRNIIPVTPEYTSTGLPSEDRLFIPVINKIKESQEILFVVEKSVCSSNCTTAPGKALASLATGGQLSTWKSCNNS